MDNKNLIILFFLSFWAFFAVAQETSTSMPGGTLIDGVAAVVGKSTILLSELEANLLQYKRMEPNIGSDESAKCELLEDMIFSKMLLDKAEFDSLTVNENQINNELEYRIRYFVSQIGSHEKLEEYFGKPMEEIREELSNSIREQNLVNMAREEVTKDITITPSEVRKLYKSIPIDSIPMVNSEVVVQEIVKQPKVGMGQVIEIKERLRSFRQRVLDGEKFSTLAILYSEDPGSANKGGELGYYGRGELYPEFETAAFKLEPGEMSDVVETKAGFHIVEMIDRRGDYINVRHILLRPKVALEDLAQAQQTLDSVAILIRKGEISIDDAIRTYSESDNKIAGGYIINPHSNSSKWELGQLDPKMLYVIDKLNEGEISNPVLFEKEDGNQAYRILYLKSKSEPHRASLETDYDKIQDWALEKKKLDAVQKWMKEQSKKTYIRVDNSFKCNFNFLNK
ncbi:MAG: peptidylprolyl isomerase [Bacteroidales bacterium]|jgi:peptidyl-prolyl cis-trans isomerase SurA|nr:peptidylprolyl isomerase [Bacteroidales bacterium]